MAQAETGAGGSAGGAAAAEAGGKAGAAAGEGAAAGPGAGGMAGEGAGAGPGAAGRSRGRGLGRGLAALMDKMGTPAPAGAPDPGAGAADGARLLPLALIDPNPHQPRRDFAPETLAELADSIRARGVLQPILVRAAAGGRYQIVAGERRWRAAQLAGLHEIPAVVRAFSDVGMFEAAIIENVQRQDLNPMEESEAYQRLAQDFRMSQQEIARAVGKSRSHVANLVRLALLPEAAKALVRSGQLSLGHAKVLAGAPLADVLAQEAVEKGLSVRQLEARVRALEAAAAGNIGGREKDGGRPRGAGAVRDADTRALEAELHARLGLPVSIEARADGSGQIAIAWRTLEQLDALIARLQA